MLDNETIAKAKAIRLNPAPYEPPPPDKIALAAFIDGLRQRAAAARAADPATRGRRSERKALKGRCKATTAKGAPCDARAKWQGYCGRHSSQANAAPPDAPETADDWLRGRVDAD